MAKQTTKTKGINKSTLGLLDSRTTDENTGLLIQRDRRVTMLDIFGTEEKAAVAHFVAQKQIMGHSNKRIAEEIKAEFGLEWSYNKVAVVKDLNHRLWRSEIAHTMNEQIAKEVATIDFQLAELWDSWEKSKKLKHIKSHSANGRGVVAPEQDYELNEVTTDVDETPGDPKIMAQIIELGKERRKLLGLYAPEKKEKNNGGVNNAVQFNIVDANGQLTNSAFGSMMAAAQQAFSQQANSNQQENNIEDVEPEGQGNEMIDAFLEEIMS